LDEKETALILKNKKKRIKESSFIRGEGESSNFITPNRKILLIDGRGK